MKTCVICKREFKSNNSLMKHVHAAHREYTSKKYYDDFIRDSSEGLCMCGAETTFRGLEDGYLKYCSVTCRSSDPSTREKISKSHTGKKQSQEHINKRVNNTNQAFKEANRKKTCIERFGVDNPSKDSEIREKMSQASLGRSRPHQPGQAAKIAENKKRNGTNLHTQETKNRISESIRASEKFDSAKLRGDFVKGGEKSSGRSLGGCFKGLPFRSSYELAFLIEMHILGLEVESAECVKFRCRYLDSSDKERWYYPDFYIASTDTVVEIKPRAKILEDKNTQLKIAAAKSNIAHRLEIISESELLDITELIKDPEIKQHLEVKRNEHLCDRSRPRLGGTKSL
jgi:hypothetical protein